MRLKSCYAGDFLVDLPKSYRIQGQWECALTEITFVSQLERLTQRIYVCCDLADQSYVKETSLPVLRSIDVDADEKVDLIFNPPHYLKVNRQDLSRIQIFIRDDELNPCRFKIDRLYCTLIGKIATDVNPLCQTFQLGYECNLR
jgi:hypothetical protein